MGAVSVGWTRCANPDATPDAQKTPQLPAESTGKKPPWMTKSMWPPSSVQKATSSNKVCQCMAEGAHLRVFHASKGYLMLLQCFLPRNVQRYAPIQRIVWLIPKIKAHLVI